MERIKVITGVQRRRRYTAEEKAALVTECIKPGMSVSLVARRHGISASLLFKWEKLMNDGGYSAIEAGDVILPTTDGHSLKLVNLPPDVGKIIYLNDLPDAQSVMRQLARWFEDYNEIHPHKGLKMKPPREYRALMMSTG